MHITSLLFFIIFVWQKYESLANTVENPVQECFGFCDQILDPNSTYEQKWNETETRIKTLQDKIIQIENELAKPKPKIDGFIQIGSRYFHIEVDFRVTWYKAIQLCLDKGGQLAVIQNEEELKAISAKLDEGSSYWLDINDLAYEGQFESWASGKKTPFLKWYHGEPNNVNDDEDCVFLKNHEMSDIHCYSSLYYICQSDIVDW